MLIMNRNDDFMLSIRCGDWVEALLLVEGGTVTPTIRSPVPSIRSPEPSIFAWLIEINAPPALLTRLLKNWADQGAVDSDSLGLLEFCMYFDLTHSHALPTFAALLDLGLSPNTIIDSGATLLQKAMELDKIREVKLLLQYGVNPQQSSVFGSESTTNLEEAASLQTNAAKLAEAWFRSNRN
jgi:hypothetical protein